MNRLKTIESSIRHLESLLLTNKEYMTEDDAKELETTINDMKVIYADDRRDWYTEQLRAFRDYLSSSVAYRDQDKLDEFTSKPFTLIHDDREVVIENSADVYEALFGLILNELDLFK